MAGRRQRGVLRTRQLIARGGAMFVTALVTFLVTTGLYAALVGWGAVRVIRHLQTDRAAVQAVIEHVLMPILGRRPEQVEKKKPSPKDARLC